MIIYHEEPAKLLQGPGDHDTANVVTKSLNGDEIDFFMDRYGFMILEGRSELLLRAAVQA